MTHKKQRKKQKKNARETIETPCGELLIGGTRISISKIKTNVHLILQVYAYVQYPFRKPGPTILDGTPPVPINQTVLTMF